MEYLILQVTATQVNISRFEISRSSAQLLESAAVALNEECSLADAARLISGRVNSSPHVVLCLPPSLFAQRSIQLPFEDLRKVREVLSAQLQGEIAVPVEELALDALPAGKGRFLALWARKHDIEQAIVTFRNAGLEPRVVSSHHFAWHRLPSIPADGILYDGSVLAIMSEGSATFFRAIETASASSVIPATLSALELAGITLPDKLYLFGDGTDSRAGLEEILLRPAEVLQPPENSGQLFKNEQAFQDLASVYAVASACHAGTLPDFRRGPLAWTSGDVKLRKKLMVTGLLAVLVVVLLFVSKGLQYRAAVADIASVDKSITAMYREIFPTRSKAVDEIAEVKGEIRKLAGVENAGGCLDVFKKLAEAKGSTINGLYEAELEGRNLRIKGDARSAQSVNEFKTALAPLLTSAEVGEVKSRPDGTATFSLTGILKEVAK